MGATFYLFAGAVGIVWGTIVAVFNTWAASWMRRVQGIYGRRAAARITPGYVRVCGIGVTAFGVAFMVMAATGVIPGR